MVKSKAMSYDQVALICADICYYEYPIPFLSECTKFTLLNATLLLNNVITVTACR